MPDLETRDLLTRYNQLYKETDEVYHSLARHYGLSDCALWILYTLRESADSIHTQKSLCNSLHLSKQTINSALKKMETDGYICLEPLAGDLRNKQIILTTAGIDFARQTADNILLMDQNAFESFSTEERTAFMHLMGKYVAQLRTEAEKILQTSANRRREE